MIELHHFLKDYGVLLATLLVCLACAGSLLLYIYKE